jgi:hypothetical protein
MKLFAIAIAGLLMFLASAQQDQDMTDCPMHDQHTTSHDAQPGQQKSEHHIDAVNRRGDEAMDFDHAKTTHHFLLQPEGGTIRVEANDVADDASRSSIRTHLVHIAKAFSEGDFNIPMFVHDQIPPGVLVMKSKKDQIKYEYRELPAGAEVVITSSDRQAVRAIHQFLQFQIRDHRTTDKASVR